MYKLNLQLFGGRGSSGGNNPTPKTEQERLREAKDEIRTTEELSEEIREGNHDAKALAEDFGVPEEVVREMIRDQIQADKEFEEIERKRRQAIERERRAAQKVAKKPEPKVEPVKKTTSTTPRVTSSKKIESLVDKLETSGTLIGTRGNTTYVVEKHDFRGEYRKPDGSVKYGIKTNYTVIPFVKGRDSADHKIMKESELLDYMKSTGATWKARKKKLSDKQKDKLF